MVLTKKKIFSIFLLIALTFSFITVSQGIGAAPHKVKWAGVRESAYGVKMADISQFPDPAGWSKAMNSMVSRWQGAVPSAIWLVGEVDYGTKGTTLQFTSPGGTYDSKIEFDPNQYNGVNHEACLTYFDTHGIKVWLQIEPGFANVPDQINAVLKKLGHHKSVLGLAIDVEWYRKASDEGDNAYVTDSEAKNWEDLVKSYDNNFTLLLKHYDPKYLPPSYRGDIVFCCDDEQNGSLDVFLEEHKEVADRFYPNPVIYQIGYPSDKAWWGKYDDAPKTMGDALAAQSNKDQEIGIMWVDFSLSVLPYIDNGLPSKGPDLNGDGAINMADVILIAMVFNTTSENSKYIPAYDLNGDGAINMADVIAIASNFNKLVQSTGTSTVTPTSKPTPHQLTGWIFHRTGLEL